MKRKFQKKLILVSIISLTLFQACSTFLFGSKEKEFIKVQGPKLMIGEEPYLFTGTNFWYGCYLGADSEFGDRDRLERELDYLKSIGVTNLRILAASEESSFGNSLKPAITSEPEIYNEELLEGLDYLLYQMAEREMHAVLFLNNYWEWSGGMLKYNEWFATDDTINIYDPNLSWEGYNSYVSSFYRNEKANEYFQKYIEKIVTRKNIYNDLFYFEDPTIMAWQLANEPRPGEGEVGTANIAYYYKWIDETAKFIQALDTNHLVSTGSEGTIGSLRSEEFFINAHSSKNIDYLTFHIWAKNWNWFDPLNVEETYDQAIDSMTIYFNQHMRLARELNKPIVLEEFGLPRDEESYERGSTTITRDDYFSKVLELVKDSAHTGAPISGINFWAWGGEGISSDGEKKWYPGNPFTGDPPQEPQGLYSVFNTDSSTIDIIKKFSSDFRNIVKEK